MPEVFKGNGAPSAGEPAGGDGDAAVAGPEYPSSWRSEDRGLWDSSDEGLRKIIAAREANWSKESERYKQAHDNWSRYHPIIERHQPLFQAEGIAPEMGIQNVLQLAHDLRFGDQATKARILESLNSHYGSKQPKKEYLDPEVAELREEYDLKMQELEQRLKGVDTGLRGYMEEETRRAIDVFAKNPERKHFSKLSQMMGRLISGGVANGLEDAYEMAGKLSGLSEPAKQPAPPAADVKAAQSRQALQAAGVNVRGNGVAPPGNKPKAPTLRKALEAQFDRIQART